MSGKVVSFKGEKRPGRRRRTQRNPGSSGVGTGFAWYRQSQSIHLYCRSIESLTVQAVVDMTRSPEEFTGFLKAWKRMKGFEASAPEGTIAVHMELPGWQTTCEMVEMPWVAVRTTIATFGRLPGLGGVDPKKGGA